MEVFYQDHFLEGYEKISEQCPMTLSQLTIIDKLEFIVLSKPICFFFSKYGNITISIWIVIMKIATKLF